VLTKNVLDENIQVIDYHQYVAAGLKASTKPLSSTLHFYDMFIHLLEYLFAAHTPFGELLLQSRDQLDKAKKIVHIALRLTTRNFAPPTLDFEFIYEELTKIRHLSFINLQTQLYKDISPLSRIQRINWPLSPLNDQPDCLTFKTTSRFEQKARKILNNQQEKILLFVDQCESWPIYDMFPEHGGIFMNIELKKQLYQILSMLQKGNNRPCPPSLPITSRSTPIKPTTLSSASMMSEDDKEDLFLSKKEFALFIDYGIVSEEAAARQLAIQESRNPDHRIQGIFFPTILPISAPKNIDLNELQWMKHRSSSPPAWSSQHHSAYKFAKIFAPDVTNKQRHSYSKSSHVFPQA
jgi:hypothetical protein